MEVYVLGVVIIFIMCCFIGVPLISICYCKKHKTIQSVERTSLIINI